MVMNKEDEATAISGAGQAAKQILDEIISGDLKAGGRLYIRDLMMRTGLGPTPLREGMSRLVASGLVKAIDQRGFQVTRIERSDIDDYTAYRLLLKQEAVRQAIENGDTNWRDGLLAALDVMASYAALPRERRRDALSRYSAAHSGFHRALFAACPSPRLKDNVDLLLDQEKFYCHNVVAADDPIGDLIAMHPVAEHRQLASAALDGDVEKTRTLLKDHQVALARTLKSRL